RCSRCLPPLMNRINCYADEYEQRWKQHVVQPSDCRRQADYGQQNDKNAGKTAQRRNDASNDAKSKKSLIVHEAAPQFKYQVGYSPASGARSTSFVGVLGRGQRNSATTPRPIAAATSQALLDNQPPCST
ncbi:MAG: hypothetical protein ACI89J_004108, partial [Hyphomicrobiaceae bacterium]